MRGASATEIEPAVPILLDRDPDLSQRNLLDPDFFPQKRQQFDLKRGLSCGRDVRPTVTKVNVLERDVQTGEKGETQPAADADLHPEGARDGRFQPRLVDVGVYEKGHGCCDEHNKTDQSGNSEEDDAA